MNGIKQTTDKDTTQELSISYPPGDIRCEWLDLPDGERLRLARFLERPVRGTPLSLPSDESRFARSETESWRACVCAIATTKFRLITVLMGEKYQVFKG